MDIDLDAANKTKMDIDIDAANQKKLNIGLDAANKKKMDIDLDAANQKKMDSDLDAAKNKLVDAVKKKDVNEVVQIIDENDLDWGEISDELSPFHIALQEKAIEICEFFIDRKLFLQNKNTEYGLPLHRASLDDVPIEIFRSLLPITSLDEDDRKELFTDTVRALQIEKLKVIIAFFSPIKCFTYHHGVNILHFFCDFVLSESHETLHSAGKCLEIPKILLAAGIPIDATDYHGNTYLHLAGNRCLRVVEFLTKRGVDVNAVTTLSKQTPMHLICGRLGNIGETVDILLKYGADINAQNQFGCTPLLMSARSFNHQIETLLSRHARTDISDHYKHTVFHSIALCDFGRTGNIVKIMKSLLDASDNINNRDINSETAMHAVLANDGCLQIVHFLLKNGDDLVNAKDKAGTLPIHLAARFEDTILIEELLKAGADIRGTDKYGCNALHYAASLGNANGVKYLVSKGLHLQEKTRNGFTALDLAKMNQCHTVVDLIENGVENPQQKASKHNSRSNMFVISESDGNRLISKISFAPVECEYMNANFENPCCDSKGRKMSLSENINDETMESLDNATNNSRDQQGTGSVCADEVSDLEDLTDTSFSDSWVEGIPLTEIPAWIDEYRKEHSKSSCKEYGCKENADLALELYEKTNESWESKLLLQEILQILEKGMRVVEESNELFKVKIQLTGSAKEGAMVWGVSNDYDVLCILSDMSNFVEVTEYEDYPPGFVKLMLKQDNPRAKRLQPFCNLNGYINSNLLARTFHEILLKAFLKNDILEGTGLSLLYPKTGLISSMNLKWSGPISKFLPISIDLVPAIAVKGWLPNRTREKSDIISDDMKDHGCMIVTKSPPQDNEGEVDHEFFRVSFSDVECQTLANLPREIKLGYCMAKSMRYTDYLPYLMVNEDGGRFEAPVLLTSYMLKTALLHELERTNVHCTYSRNAERDKTLESKQWVFRIYKSLLDFLMQKFMPSYYLPSCNAIASNFSHFGTEDATEHQIAYCKVLLAVLEQHTD